MTNPEKKAALVLSDQIYAEKIGMLYTMGSIFRPALHIPQMIIFVIAIIGHVNSVHAYIWGMLMTAVCAYRVLEFYIYRKNIHIKRDYKVAHARFLLGAGLLGLCYSLGFAFFFDQLPLVNQVYLLLIITAATLGTLGYFAPDKISLNLFLYTMTIPVAVSMLVEGQNLYLILGSICIVYILSIKKLFMWHNKVVTEMIQLGLENKKLLNSLQGINASLTELSLIDELTQVANRRSLDDNLEKEWSRARRMNKPISMLMIDIDYFKQYNDEFGHLKGDECLTYIAKYLKNNLNRSGDFIARYGGEEFCIIMPDTNLDGAVTFAEKIHSGVRDLKISNPGSKISKYLTISIGVASAVPVRNEGYMDLIYTSDKALYNAKNDGRNIIRTKDILENNPKPQLVV